MVDEAKNVYTCHAGRITLHRFFKACKRVSQRHIACCSRLIIDAAGRSLIAPQSLLKYADNILVTVNRNVSLLTLNIHIDVFTAKTSQSQSLFTVY